MMFVVKFVRTYLSDQHLSKIILADYFLSVDVKLLPFTRTLFLENT